MEFVRSEIFGLRKSLDAFRGEERRKDDELKAGIDSTKVELREESRAERQYVESIKKEIKQEMHDCWVKAEAVFEARRQDVYMIHGRIDQLKDDINKKFDDLK